MSKEKNINSMREGRGSNTGGLILKKALAAKNSV